MNDVFEMMEDEDLKSIRDILENVDENNGWLYLPERPWTLDTKGVFAPYGRDSVRIVPKIARDRGFKITVDSDTIEDIISNAECQLKLSSIQKIFEAFVFYNDKDAFIKFK